VALDHTSQYGPRHINTTHCRRARSNWLDRWAVYFAIEYRRLDRQFFDWIDARPLTIKAALSQPSRLTAHFNQTCQISHGEAFYLTVNPNGDLPKSDVLKGLEGTITTNDAEGNEIESLKMTSQVASEVGLDEPIMLAYFHPFATGDYTATIDVEHGAPALDGREQSIHARYLLCGLERFPVMISGFLALACGIPGITIGVIVTKGFVKHGIAPPQTNATEQTDAPKSRLVRELKMDDR
jgi:hypothetical protein